MSGQQHVPTELYPRERPGTHCTGGCAWYNWYYKPALCSCVNTKQVRNELNWIVVAVVVVVEACALEVKRSAVSDISSTPVLQVHFNEQRNCKCNYNCNDFIVTDTCSCCCVSKNSVAHGKRLICGYGLRRRNSHEIMGSLELRHASNNFEYNVNENPTRCKSMQIFIYCKVTLHVSGVTAPITRSTKNCNRSLRYRS